MDEDIATQNTNKYKVNVAPMREQDTVDSLKNAIVSYKKMTMEDLVKNQASNWI